MLPKLGVNANSSWPARNDACPKCRRSDSNVTVAFLADGRSRRQRVPRDSPRCARFDVYVHAISHDAERTRDVHAAMRGSFRANSPQMRLALELDEITDRDRMQRRREGP